MTYKRYLFSLATYLLLTVGSTAFGERAVCQDVAKGKVYCQGETCATIAGTIDDGKLPPRKSRAFLVSLYPAPYGEYVARIAAVAGETFTLPPQKPGFYVISVSGYTSECDIQWKKKVKLRAGERKTINPKPTVVSVSGCE
jgi:hypothetical protein